MVNGIRTLYPSWLNKGFGNTWKIPGKRICWNVSNITMNIKAIVQIFEVIKKKTQFKPKTKKTKNKNKKRKSYWHHFGYLERNWRAEATWCHLEFSKNQLFLLVGKACKEIRCLEMRRTKLSVILK